MKLIDLNMNNIVDKYKKDEKRNKERCKEKIKKNEKRYKDKIKDIWNMM